MEKYLKAVSEMYSQFKNAKVHPLEKYIGRLAKCCGEKLEVVGYRNYTDGTRVLIGHRNHTDGTRILIVDGTKIRGWSREVLDSTDVVFKRCERYWYVSIDDLID